MHDNAVRIANGTLFFCKIKLKNNYNNKQHSFHILTQTTTTTTRSINGGIRHCTAEISYGIEVLSTKRIETIPQQKIFQVKWKMD